MQDHGLAGELPADDRARPDAAGGPAPSRPAAAALSVAEIVALCDRQLREVGRRNHLFGWLRRPGGEVDAWLPVDAYYPRNRLVVIWRTAERPHDGVYRELIPAHGLHLLELTPADLGRTRAGVEAALAAKLAKRPAPSRRPEDSGERPARRPAAEPAAARGSRSTTSTDHEPARRLSAAERASRFLAARAGRPTAPARRERQSTVVAIAVAIALGVLMAVVALYLLSIVRG